MMKQKILNKSPLSQNRVVPINSNITDLKVSATLAINEKCRELISKGKNVFKLGLGQSPFPVPDTIVKALMLYAPQKDYLSVKGLPALREAVAEFHRRKDLVDARADLVLIGPGSKELLFLLQMVFDGEIIIVSPSWVSYAPQSYILAKKLHIIHTDKKERWRLTPELLNKFCGRRVTKPRLLILNYPGNPDGVTYDQEELKAIAQVAKENNIYILSDEIYGQLHHQGKHFSIARYYPEGTIISSGLSKWCGAGGWRLGTFTFPKQLKILMEAMSVVASETYTSVSAPIQYAAIFAFKGGLEIEQYLSHTRRILQVLGKQCADILSNGGISTLSPTGGFYLFLDFSGYSSVLHQKGILNSATLCERLLEQTGIAILPGSDFNRPADELTARLAYVDFDGAEALAASQSIPLDFPLPDDFARLWCEKVLMAVEKIVEWTKKRVKTKT